MWKILVGFAAFAALAIFILMKSGGDIDLSGEKHDVAAPHVEGGTSAVAAPASAPAPASAASH